MSITKKPLEPDWLTVQDKNVLEEILGGKEKDVFLVSLIQLHTNILGIRLNSHDKNILWKQIRDRYNRQFNKNYSVDKIKKRWNKLVMDARKEIYGMIGKKTAIGDHSYRNYERPTLLSLQVWKTIVPYMTADTESLEYRLEFKTLLHGYFYVQSMAVLLQDFVDYSDRVFRLIRNLSLEQETFEKTPEKATSSLKEPKPSTSKKTSPGEKMAQAMKHGLDVMTKASKETGEAIRKSLRITAAKKEISPKMKEALVKDSSSSESQEADPDDSKSSSDEDQKNLQKDKNNQHLSVPPQKTGSSMGSSTSRGSLDSRGIPAIVLPEEDNFMMMSFPDRPKKDDEEVKLRKKRPSPTHSRADTLSGYLATLDKQAEGFSKLLDIFSPKKKAKETKIDPAKSMSPASDSSHPDSSKSERHSRPVPPPADSPRPSSYEAAPPLPPRASPRRQPAGSPGPGSDVTATPLSAGPSPQGHRSGPSDHDSDVSATQLSAGPSPQGHRSDPSDHESDVSAAQHPVQSITSRRTGSSGQSSEVAIPKGVVRSSTSRHSGSSVRSVDVTDPKGPSRRSTDASKPKDPVRSSTSRHSGSSGHSIDIAEPKGPSRRSTDLAKPKDVVRSSTSRHSGSSGHSVDVSEPKDVVRSSTSRHSGSSGHSIDVSEPKGPSRRSTDPAKPKDVVRSSTSRHSGSSGHSVDVSEPKDVVRSSTSRHSGSSGHSVDAPERQGSYIACIPIDPSQQTVPKKSKRRSQSIDPQSIETAPEGSKKTTSKQ